MGNRFSKNERLYGLKKIEKLYNEGEALMAYPFRLVLLNTDENAETEAVRVMMSVSKKRFKRAVDRNRIKRLMREAYRLNKQELKEYATASDLHIYIAFQYIAKEILPFHEVEEKMKKALHKLISHLDKKG